MDTKTILFYGDSNTYGYDPRLGFDDRYPEEVRWADRLKKALPGWRILAAGMNGREIPAHEGGYARVGALIRKVQEEGPLDCFAVMLGTNDILSIPAGRPSGYVAERLDRFLQYLREGFPELALLVIAPPPVGSGDSPDPELRYYHEECLCMNRLFQRAAERMGADYVNTADWDLPMSYDGVHLSEEGHLVFAERMKEWLAGQESGSAARPE